MSFTASTPNSSPTTDPVPAAGPTPLEKAVSLHPHLSDPVPDGHVRVDMHMHTMYSGDAVTTLDEVAERVESTGLDVLCITDHNAVRGALAALESGLGCRVIVGEELRTTRGEIIGLFLDEHVPIGLTPHEAAARIRDQDALVYIPHPFDPIRRPLQVGAIDELVADGLVDAFEVFNAKVSLASLNERAASYATEHGLAAGAGSDAHDPAALGAAYVTIPDFDGPQEFLSALGEGQVTGHHFDRARAWAPRIIPRDI